MKNNSLYHIPKENSALSSVGRLTLIEGSCPLRWGVCGGVFTNTYEDLKNGLGAKTCLFCHFCLLFFQLHNTDL